MTPLDSGIDYEPIGSLSGEVRVTQRAADFGAFNRRSRPRNCSYVEFGQVVRAGLAYALMQNKASAFVTRGQASFIAAAASAEWARPETSRRC